MVGMVQNEPKFRVYNLPCTYARHRFVFRTLVGQMMEEMKQRVVSSALGRCKRSPVSDHPRTKVHVELRMQGLIIV